MKKMKSVGTFCALCLLSVLCVSCLHNNSYSFEVQNLTGEPMVVVTDSILPALTVRVTNQGIRDANDTSTEFYNKTYKNGKDTVFAIPSNHSFYASTYWKTKDDLGDSPEADGVKPAWKFIRSIRVGEHYLDPSVWNSEARWELHSDNDKEHNYRLVIR